MNDFQSVLLEAGFVFPRKGSLGSEGEVSHIVIRGVRLLWSVQCVSAEQSEAAETVSPSQPHHQHRQSCTARTLQSDIHLSP